MNRLGKIAVAVTVVFWSGGNLIVRDTSLTGPQIAFWRYLIAAGIYSVVHLAFVGPLRLEDAKRAAPTAITVTFEVVVFFVALKETTVASATVIGSLMPLLLFGVASRRFAERVPVDLIVATIVAIVGVGLVVFGPSDSVSWNPTGDLLAVVALVLFAAYFALAKTARESLSSLTLQTHVLLLGTPIVLVVTLIDSGELYVPRSGEWLGVFGLILFPTTGHLLINWAHAHVSLTLTSLMTLGVPVLSTLGAALFFNDILTNAQLAGIGIVTIVLAWAVVQTNRITPAGT